MADILEYTIDRAVDVGNRLKEGQVGIFPCDTIYGLCGTADEKIAERLYEIKRRPQSKSFITLMTLDQVVENGFSVPDDILSRWPAALTAIVFGPDGKTHAIRVPADSFVQDVLPVFSDSVDFIVNAPLIKGGMASTLVDATSSPYKVLRQGSYII